MNFALATILIMVRIWIHLFLVSGFEQPFQPSTVKKYSRLFLSIFKKIAEQINIYFKNGVNIPFIAHAVWKPNKLTEGFIGIIK